MEKRRLGRTGFSIAPLVIGGNVFGWTADERESFAILDAFVDHGINAIDTADVYSSWADGNKGGESETVIGKWLRARPGLRDKLVMITKVGSDLGAPGQKGLSDRWIREAVEGSLSRLGIDAIDVYLSHWPDNETPYAETLGAYADLMQDGKIKAIGASNLDAEQLAMSLRVARDNSLPAYQVVEPEYSLVMRGKFEGALQDLCVENDIGVVSYYALSAGFLTGKYRTEADLQKGSRGSSVKRYMTPKGLDVLKAASAVAEGHGVSETEVALAWVMAQKGITAPIASASRIDQVATLIAATKLRLTADDLAHLDAASA